MSEKSVSVFERAILDQDVGRQEMGVLTFWFLQMNDI